MTKVSRALRLLALALPMAFGACKGGGGKALPKTLPAVSLPAGDLEAGRALGKAAATEKDPAKLAATIVAFLDRLHVPVLSEKGDALLAKGPFTADAPKPPWLWEPVVVGVARATTLGDERPFADVLAAFVHPLDPKKAAAVDFGALVSELADAAGRKPMPVFGPIAAALAEDLKERHALRAHPHLDPTATLLVGLLLVAEQIAERESPPPAAPTASGPPRPGPMPFPIPRLPVVPGRAHALGFAGGGSSGGDGVVAAACKWIGKASSVSGSIFSGLGGGLGNVKSAGGAVGLNMPGLDSFLAAIAPALEAANLAGEVTDGIAGMGIAAFVVADGDVKPTKVKYGDGPATYTVHVKSDSPFDKSQLDQFVDCLEATTPMGASALESLRSIPPKGGMADVPVLWLDTSQYDPKHGKFTPNNGSVPDGIVSSLVKAGVSALGGGTTDSSGETKAQFQVKPKKSDARGSRFKRYTITAKVFPFPVGGSVVFGGANALFNRDVPIALEIEVPLDDWIMNVDWKLRVQPMGGMTYFEEDGHAQVKFKLDPNDLSFHSTGTGTHTYTIPTQTVGPGAVTCSAPVGGQPVTISIDGKVTDYETMQADVHLGVKPDSNSEAMTITCTSAYAPGHPSTRHANARMGDISQGTKLEHFTITLDDGETLDVPVDKTAGPMQIDGPAHVAVAVDGG